MTDKLLPCPFCGGNDIQIDEMESFWDKNETIWRVLCINCIAETAGDTKEQAIAAWNSRTSDAVPVVRCGECKKRNTMWCGMKHERADMDYCSCGAKMDAGGGDTRCNG